MLVTKKKELLVYEFDSDYKLTLRNSYKLKMLINLYEVSNKEITTNYKKRKGSKGNDATDGSLSKKELKALTKFKHIAYLSTGY